MLRSYLLVLLRHRWVFLVACAAVGLAAAVRFVMTPPSYEALCTLLPETVVLVPSGLGGDLGASAALFGMPNPSTPPFSSFLQEMMGSRSLAERVARRLQLDRRLVVSLPDPLASSTEYALIYLQSHVSVRQNTRGVYWSTPGSLTIRATASHPVLAADIANTYAIAFDRFVRETVVTSATRQRRFLEKRVEEIVTGLQGSENRLERFQREHGAVSVSDQGKATLEALSELHAKRVATELSLEAARTRLSPEHHQVRALQSELDALKKSIDLLTYSETDVEWRTAEGDVRFYVPLNKIPELSFRAGILLLDLESQQEVMKLLMENLEQAKIEEEKNLPTLTVMDYAVPGTAPSEPRLLPYAMVGVVGGMGLGLFAAFAAHASRHPRLAAPLGDGPLRQVIAGAWEADRLFFAGWLRRSAGIVSTTSRLRSLGRRR